jgi:hypothetical protein
MDETIIVGAGVVRCSTVSSASAISSVLSSITGIPDGSCVREYKSSSSDEMLSLRLADSRAVAKEFRRGEGEYDGERSVGEVGDIEGEECRKSSSVSENTSCEARRNGEGERDRSVSSPDRVKLRPLAAIDPSGGDGEVGRLDGSGLAGALRPGTRFPYSSPIRLACVFSGLTAPKPKLPVTKVSERACHTN